MYSKIALICQLIIQSSW